MQYTWKHFKDANSKKKQATKKRTRDLHNAEDSTGHLYMCVCKRLEKIQERQSLMAVRQEHWGSSGEPGDFFFLTKCRFVLSKCIAIFLVSVK